MASGTADLQRDLGGAFMQSIFGALLTAGYAAAVASAIAGRRRNGDQITSSVQAQLTKSFSSAEAVAAAVPAVRDGRSPPGAKTSFLAGADWAYSGGHRRGPASAPRSCSSCSRSRTDEERLLAEYHAEDTASVEPLPAATPSAATPSSQPA